MSGRRTTDDTLRIVLIVVAVIVLAPMLMMGLAFPMMGVWGGMMGGYGGFGVSPIWGVVMMLVWLVILVGGGYLVYRWATGAGSAGTDPALEELRLAYARGDISEEEYEQRRSRLGGE
jgi:putative membrane protein